MTTVTVVTPWADALELWPAYSAAMAAGIREGDQVIVYDNGSTPPLRSALSPLPEWLTIVRSPVNRGWTPPTNDGIRAADTDAVLAVNNDIRMTDPLWLEQIREALGPGVLVGAHLRDEPHAYVDCHPMPYLDGWCLAGMRADLLHLGCFDSTLDEPAYFGENILCARAVAADMELREIPVGLAHLGNYTSRRFASRDKVAAANRARYESVVRSLRKTAA